MLFIAFHLGKTRIPLSANELYDHGIKLKTGRFAGPAGGSRRLGLRFALCDDPIMCLVCHLREDQKVIPPESLR